MKKWVLLLLTVLILSASAIYIFIPSTIVINESASSLVTINGGYRFLSKEENWEKWWRDAKGKSHIPGQPFTYGNSEFRLTKTGYNSAWVDIDPKQRDLESRIHLIPFALDSTGLLWSCEIHSSINPLTRLKNYLYAKDLKKNIRGIFNIFSSFISDPKNVYGMAIYKTTVRDTLMVSSRFLSPAYPTTARIYGFFDTLKQTITRQKADPVGFPIMNPRKMPDGSYETQTGMPTSRLLKDDGKILAIRMPPGLFLTADARGGNFTVEKTVEIMEQFIKDYARIKIATGFQILITDRRNEPDTSKWVTKVKIPIVP